MIRDQIQIEHFKSIREENRFLGSTLQKLWRYKFSTVACVIAIGFLGDFVMHHISGTTQGPEAISFISISFIIAPILAFIIDIKMLEAAMYLQIASEHIKEQYSDVEVIQDFEGRIWEDQSLAFQRTLLSFILSVIVSVAILIMSFFIYMKLQPEWTKWSKGLLVFDGIIVVSAFVALIILVGKFLKRRDN